MTANGSTTFPWADGEYTFNIAKHSQILELEEKCKAGVGTIHARLLSAHDRFTALYFYNDFRETIRLGLIGGGKTPDQALALVVRYVDGRPWDESIVPALRIIQAAVVGVIGDPLGKSDADRATTESDSSTKTAGSSDPQSTDSAPPSGTHPDKSTKSQLGNSSPASRDTTERTAESHSPSP